MKKLIFAVLLAVATLASSQTTTFTANTKDLATVLPATPEAGPVYLELTLKNCAGSGTTPTIPHVNGTGVVVFPVNLYPDGTGLISKTVYDQTFITCGSSTGVGYYHIRVYQGDNTRSLVKKLLFEDDFNVQGTSFNLNSATPRSGSVITPPVATAVLTNPAGNQSIVQPAGTALSINALSATFAQNANGTDMIPASRFTDTLPTGNFLNFKNAALSTPLWQVDVTGMLTFGIVPAARVSSGAVSIANGGTGQTAAPAAFNALSPNTTLGDLTYANGAGTNTRLAGNTAATKQYLSQTGTGTVSAAPAWAQVNFTDLAGTGTCAQEPALTGDTTSSAGSCATTTAKVNGVSYPASPSTHAVPVTTAANTETYKVVPDCTDTTGNHINYTQSTDVWSCGTSVPANTVTTTGTQILTSKTLGGTTPYNRLRANQGTALVNGDVSGVTNFGTTASVSSVSGTDAAGTIAIASAGTGQAANGTFTLTFHDGTWTTAPVCVADRGDGNGPNSAPVATAPTATNVLFIFAGAAIAGTTYAFNFICLGKP